MSKGSSRRSSRLGVPGPPSGISPVLANHKKKTHTERPGGVDTRARVIESCSNGMLTIEVALLSEGDGISLADCWKPRSETVSPL